MRRRLRRVWPVIWGLAGFIGLFYWAWVPADLSNPACGRGHNAAWISVDWTSRPVDAAAVSRLAESAKERGMRYLFPYVSYLKRDGSFNKTYAHARDFVTTYRQRNPDTKLLAWIGLPLTRTTDSTMQGWVDLSNQSTRQFISAFAADIVQQAGFDGVHINAEPVLRDNMAFLMLLEELRSGLGPNKLISVSGHHWIADWLTGFAGTSRSDWTSAYYQAVAKRVDQIAVMTYDSQLTSPALYRLWVREQVRHIEQSINTPNAILLIGLSVSREETASHHPSAETLADGLAGFCAAAANQSSKIEGVAVYADWEFAEFDGQIWQTWQLAAK